MIHVYFKLFNNIKSPHEAKDLARLELEGLFGPVEPVGNFIDEFLCQPLRRFVGARFPNGREGIRVVDCFTYELPYGKIQGYKGTLRRVVNLSRLIRRLAYTREIFVVVSSRSPEKALKRLFPQAAPGKNAHQARVAGFTLFRFITHQYFLEKSEYISKLSRDENEVEQNVDRLFAFPSEKFYRIPASTTMRVGKRLEDYLTIREEPSLYLVHYMHPYKGKFHPKMVRAILNYVHPDERGTVMDNFAGSGTMLVEAVLMGLDAIGVEINPLSVLMSNVKCHSLSLEPKRLKKGISEFLQRYELAMKSFAESLGTLDSGFSLERIRDERRSIANEVADLKEKLMEWDNSAYGLDEARLVAIVLAKREVANVEDPKVRDFLLLALSGSISDIARRRSAGFSGALSERLQDLYLRVYLFSVLNRTLKIDLGNAQCYTGDTRDLSSLALKTVDGNVNSPPYSTALNYVENDQPQLTVLGLHPDLDKLIADMIGFPGKNYDKRRELSEIQDGAQAFRDLPQYAREMVRLLLDGGREDHALRSFKFFKDTFATMREMWKVLRPGSKYAIIIGNNHFKRGHDGEDVGAADSEEETEPPADLEYDTADYLKLPLSQPGYVEVKNDRVTIEIGQTLGFELDTVVQRVLEKTSAGNIRYESIVILKKP